MATNSGEEYECDFKIEAHSSDERAYKNPFPDYMSALSDETSLIDFTEELAIVPEFVAKIKYFIAEQLEVIGDEYNFEKDQDWTVYTGSCGIAYLQLQLSKTLYRNDAKARKACLDRAGEILKKARTQVYHAYPGFLMGDAGPYAVSILHSHATGDREGVAKHTGELLNLKQLVLSEASETNENEVLYGNAGYLYALLLVRNLVPEAGVSDEVVKQVTDVIVAHGLKISSANSSLSAPLLYLFGKKPYMGAAHGLAGVVYMLLMSAEATNSGEHMELLKSCVDYILGSKLTSGNYPSYIGESNDLLVHWCHGAPGMVVLFCRAYVLTHDMNYLKAAIEGARLIWERGLLKKGLATCHGVVGNAYAFLQLYKVTQDGEYLYYALKFAEWCMEARKAWGHPDRPLTLFEGMAGALYFLSGLHDFKNAAFPGYEL